MNIEVMLNDENGDLVPINFLIDEDEEHYVLEFNQKRYSVARDDLIRLGIASIPLTYKSNKIGEYDDTTRYYR